MLKGKENYDRLKDLAIGEGASLFGVAEIESFKERFLLSPSELNGLKYGISIGVALSPAVLAGIVDQPTMIYKWHYRQANNLLDRVAFLVTLDIMKLGFNALPIPASQIVDWEAQKGAVSHRTLGEAAGLGWRGRNNLLVNETYGSRIRLVSVLTDLPLKFDPPKQDQTCGSCKRCISLCPAGALDESPEQYDFDKCFNLLKNFSKLKGIGQYICGVCVKACPGKYLT